MMKKLTAILSLGLISCGQTATSDKKVAGGSIGNDSKNVPTQYIDSGLQAYLDTALKGWTLPAPNRWDTVWYNQYKNQDNLVNHVQGDFDCNKRPDYALIFKKGDGTLVAYAFLSKGGSFESFELIDLGKDTNGLIEFGLELMPPGKYTYMDPESDEAPSVRINCHAVQVLSFEKGAETFYWEKGELKSIMTGD
jgi:hypothetical protein